MKSNLIKLSLILIINFFVIETSYSIEPTKFVQQTVNKASEALSNNISKKRKIEVLKEIARNSVDIKGIGMYTLGSHRKNLNESQKITYEKLFELYFLKSFASRLSEYTDPKIIVNSQKAINKNYTIVSSVLIANEKRPEVKIDWRVYTKNKEEPLIRDLIIEGLSLARTLKEEFNSIIQNNNNDINQLFLGLQNFIDAKD